MKVAYTDPALADLDEITAWLQQPLGSMMGSPRSTSLRRGDRAARRRLRRATRLVHPIEKAFAYTVIGTVFDQTTPTGALAEE